MAESVVCFVIEKLVSLLISTEAKLSGDVRKEVGCIRDELESIRSFLKDGDAKEAVEGEMDDSIKTWVRQIREAISEDEVLGLQSISTPPQFIRLLYLKGHLEKLRSWISQLHHLVKLQIFWSRLRDSPLKAFQNLPHLLELGFSYKAYDDNGVMPDLQELQIGPSPQLKEVPSGIHHLRNLTTLRFVDMPKQFPGHMDPNNGQHYWVV
ncbi:hypothetical protein L3X38_014818 [Prunus dulcis]|uniref:Disease resistance N-terminal domain-containing protein n=1 Tax=Prunus dulcis TaxID=3755 RepID=A0AAD4WQJ2_PRUDU|nr:hypothetical protein L3X38_014818 [Prunus dulcis]